MSFFNADRSLETAVPSSQFFQVSSSATLSSRALILVRFSSINRPFLSCSSLSRRMSCITMRLYHRRCSFHCLCSDKKLVACVELFFEHFGGYVSLNSV